jgi:hypothetical protein
MTNRIDATRAEGIDISGPTHRNAIVNFINQFKGYRCKYTPDDYDKHPCLNPTVGLYVAILFSMKEVPIMSFPATCNLLQHANNLALRRS